MVIGKREMPSLEFQFIFVSVRISFERSFMSVGNAAPTSRGAGMCMPGYSFRLVSRRLGNDEAIRHHARAVAILEKNVVQKVPGLRLVEVGLPVPPLIMVDIRAFERGRLNVGRIRLCHACINEVPASLL